MRTIPSASNLTAEAPGGSCTLDPLFTKQVLWLLSYRGDKVLTRRTVFKDSHLKRSILRNALIWSRSMFVSSRTPVMKPLRKGV